MKKVFAFYLVLISFNCYGIDWEKFKDLPEDNCGLNFSRTLAILELVNRTQDPIQQENLRTLLLVEVSVNQKQLDKSIYFIKTFLKMLEKELNECLEENRSNVSKGIEDQQNQLIFHEELAQFLREVKCELLNQ